MTARSTDELTAVGEKCRELGSKVTVTTGDVSVEADVARVIADGLADHGRIDVLINNAGIADTKGVVAEQFSAESFNHILAVDLAGAFYYARDCGKHMLERRSGSIVNICSILANGANENSIIGYTAAKGGLRNLTLQLGVEWADRGCLLYTSPSPRDQRGSRMPSSA